MTHRKAPRSRNSPCRGEAPGCADLLGRQAEVMFPIVGGSLQYLRASRFERWDARPELPSVGKFAPPYEASTWDVGTPRNRPTELFGPLNRKIHAAVVDPKMKMRFAGFRCAPVSISPAEFGKLVAGIEKWGGR